MRKKMIVTLLVLLTLGFCCPEVFIEAKEDTLALYIEELKEINATLGTSYAFPTEDQLEAMGKEYADMVEFYTAMDIAEFREYMYSIHEKAVDAKERIAASEKNESTIQTYAYPKTQSYYYDPDTINCIEVSSIAYTADGAERYSSITDVDTWDYEYPYYQLLDYEYHFYDGYTNVEFLFACKWVHGDYMMDSNITYDSVSFSAAGGNVWAGVLAR